MSTEANSAFSNNFLFRLLLPDREGPASCAGDAGPAARRVQAADGLRLPRVQDGLLRAHEAEQGAEAATAAAAGAEAGGRQGGQEV